MLPSLNLGFITLQFYPFFWGIAWALGASYIHQNLPLLHQKTNLYYLIGLFVCSVLGAKYFFNLSGGSYVFSSGLGFVFYGGLFAGGLYLYLLKLFNHAWIKYALKPLVIILPLTHAIGRVGCFFAGCCFGLSCENDFCPSGHFPLPLIEALGLSLIFLVQLKSKNQSLTNLMAQYCIGYGVLRLSLEIFRGDARGEWMQLPPGVWISLALVYLGFFIFGSGRSYK